MAKINLTRLKSISKAGKTIKKVTKNPRDIKLKTYKQLKAERESWKKYMSDYDESGKRIPSKFQQLEMKREKNLETGKKLKEGINKASKPKATGKYILTSERDKKVAEMVKKHDAKKLLEKKEVTKKKKEIAKKVATAVAIGTAAYMAGKKSSEAKAKKK